MLQHVMHRRKYLLAVVGGAAEEAVLLRVMVDGVEEAESVDSHWSDIFDQ
jgi:hypothetical protein